MISPAAFSAKWFLYSLLCVLCFGGFLIASKFGSREIPERTMYYLFTWGALPVGLALLANRRLKMEKSVKGISYSLIFGFLGGVGQLALFSAFRSGGNTAVISITTGLYSMVTVVLAVLFLRERLNLLQIVGLAFAAAAIVIFSLPA
ncbi:MAG: DMT family transporter [Verrucomicrobiales bacterium]|nr:DMT family transporter [Verrucomicrobiales bacterium]